MVKRLYVSDLDGTLLHSDQKISSYSYNTLNKLIEDGLCFSYATARSYHTAKLVTEGLNVSFPVIIYNGVLIKDNKTEEILLSNTLDKQENLSIIYDFLDHGMTPVSYQFIDGKEKFMYLPDLNKEMKEFVEAKKYDERNMPIYDIKDYELGIPFYMSIISNKEELEPFYHKYKEKYHCLFQEDLYTHYYWLEILPKSASKANAIKQLATLLHCDEIVVFGDGLNDIDMFKVADISYAMKNAVPELKRIATHIIGSNDEDSVVKTIIDSIRDDC